MKCLIMICDTHPNNKKNTKKKLAKLYNFFSKYHVSDKRAFH